MKWRGATSRYRTTFLFVNGQPAQFVAPYLQLKLPVVDLSNLSSDEAEAAVQRVIEERSHEAFDLTTAPLLRVCLMRLGAEKHLFLSVHHLIADAWSVGIFYNELSIFYNCMLDGGTPKLPELPVRYVDFAAWQKQLIDSDRLTRQLTYWRQQLNGRLPTVELPSDYARPAQPSYRGARQSFAMTESSQLQSKR